MWKHSIVKSLYAIVVLHMGDGVSVSLVGCNAVSTSGQGGGSTFL
jgi:hypothetical protein